MYYWWANGTLATTDKLHAAARLVSDTRKFDRCLRQLVHVDLHWLDEPERVKFKLVSMVHNCLHQKAPRYRTTVFLYPMCPM